MKKRKPGLKALFVIASSLITLSFTDQKPSFIDTSFKAAEKQYQFLEQAAEKQHKFPRTLSPSGQLVGTDEWDWTGGFFQDHCGISTTTPITKKPKLLRSNGRRRLKKPKTLINIMILVL